MPQSKKHIISLDIDGVLADFTELAYRAMGKTGTAGAQETWHIEGLDEAWPSTLGIPGTWGDARLVCTPPEIMYLRHLLYKYGWEVYYVTNRPPETQPVTQQWLYAYAFPSSENLIYTEDKAQALLDLVADGSTLLLGHLEDSPSNIHAIEDVGLPVVIRDWPYNRAVHSKSFRVYSLGEFLHTMEWVESSLPNEEEGED